MLVQARFLILLKPYVLQFMFRKVHDRFSMMQGGIAQARVNLGLGSEVLTHFILWYFSRPHLCIYLSTKIFQFIYL